MIAKEMNTSSTEPMSYDPAKEYAAHDKDLCADKTASGYHLIIQNNAASNVPPIHDPLTVGFIKVSTLPQVYSSKKSVSP
jgi:hypothetical protein